MWQEPNYIQHGNIAISETLINLVTNHDWSKKHLWNPQDINFKGTQALYYNFSDYAKKLYYRNYDESDLRLRDATQYILDYILTLWPDHRYVKGEISHCPPGERQGFHIDPRVFSKFGHRVHVPITTNSLCNLKVETEHQHLAQGEIWTFNNLKQHASENLGTTSRVHIVVDIMSQEIFDQLVSKYSESYLYEKTI